MIQDYDAVLDSLYCKEGTNTAEVATMATQNLNLLRQIYLSLSNLNPKTLQILFVTTRQTTQS